VVRLHGTGRHKPVLLIGHLDVVEAHREDWSTDPFTLIEKDGFFYGRGALDMKDGDAIMAATLLRMKQEGYRPSRDIILALTADEEGGCCNGVDWLLKNHRELVDGAFVLNHDGFSVKAEHGVPRVFELGATEKVYADYQLLTTNKGGHSSLPRPDNAIYELAAGLTRIGQYQFPFELNNVTRAYFEQLVAGATDARAQDLRGILKSPPDPRAIERLSAEPAYGSLMRTTWFFLRSFGPSTATSAAGKPASRQRFATASAAVVTLPTESVVLISISCLKMSRARALASRSPGAAPAAAA